MNSQKLGGERTTCKNSAFQSRGVAKFNVSKKHRTLVRSWGKHRTLIRITMSNPCGAPTAHHEPLTQALQKSLNPLPCPRKLRTLLQICSAAQKLRTLAQRTLNNDWNSRRFLTKPENQHKSQTLNTQGFEKSCFGEGFDFEVRTRVRRLLPKLRTLVTRWPQRPGQRVTRFLTPKKC